MIEPMCLHLLKTTQIPVSIWHSDSSGDEGHKIAKSFIQRQSNSHWKAIVSNPQLAADSLYIAMSHMLLEVKYIYVSLFLWKFKRRIMWY